MPKMLESDFDFAVRAERVDLIGIGKAEDCADAIEKLSDGKYRGEEALKDKFVVVVFHESSEATEPLPITAPQERGQAVARYKTFVDFCNNKF